VLHVLFLLALACAGIAFGLAVFALAAPRDFARWFTPFYLLRKLVGGSSAWPDLIFSYSVGCLSLGFLLALQFLLGGFFVTGVFRLWSSPFAMFFGP